MRFSKYRYEKKNIPPVLFIAIVLFVCSLVLLFISKTSAEYADFINENISYYVRRAMALFGDLFPFSFFELIIILLPIILTVFIIHAVRRFRSGRGIGCFVMRLSSLVLFISTLYILTLSVGYNTTSLDKRLGLSSVAVNADTLASTMTLLRDEVNSLVPMISYGSDGASVSDEDFNEISGEICKAFDSVNEEYSFPKSFESRAKSIYFGNVMSYFRLTGIYTFYTGEANVNSAYPYYDRCFTAAHELSHQRGILRENEANFMAYLVNSHSENPYLRYSAALSMYEYVASALYRTDKERYYEIVAELSEKAQGDIRASSAVTRKYGDTFLADVSNFFNDLFLKTNGTAGVVTYGMVVTLAVAYHNQ